MLFAQFRKKRECRIPSWCRSVRDQNTISHHIHFRPTHLRASRCEIKEFLHPILSDRLFYLYRKERKEKKTEYQFFDVHNRVFFMYYKVKTLKTQFFLSLSKDSIVIAIIASFSTVLFFFSILHGSIAAICRYFFEQGAKEKMF